MHPFPKEIRNRIDGVDVDPATGRWVEKFNPADGTVLCRVARSDGRDVNRAVAAARRAQPDWAGTPAVERGRVLLDVALALEKHRDEIAHMVMLETGKSHRDAKAETSGAVAQGIFMAGEGQRLYGRTMTSGVRNKLAMTIRQPVGVAGLIIAANTPIANVAWKVFPALICGNAAVLKAPEDAPATTWLFARIAVEAGLPAGVLQIVQGLGAEVGAALAERTDVELVSFTGSATVGSRIAEVVGRRLGRLSLELGGKNPFVVCDDADLDLAVRWGVLSAFSNAGQRCASGSRIIVFDSIYESFRDALVDATRALRVGAADGDDLGPVISERHLGSMISAVNRARSGGARVLIGGSRLEDPEHRDGFYMAPTLIEGAGPDDEISMAELFGPIACLYRVPGFEQALALANRSRYGLTACIHTRSLDRALRFVERVETGVAVVNAGTFGSEPHMPFGGRRRSGNGTREPGTEALDVYSELKDVYIGVDPERV